MPLFNFLIPRHRRYAELVDAFADSELGGGDLASFEAHLPACAQCQAAVAQARTLKASVSALPEFAAPRSFSLTPTMVALPVASKPVTSGTPLYLGFARAGAALSIGAFATVLAVSALDSSAQQSADLDKSAGGSRETMLSGTVPEDAGANNNAGSGNSELGGAPASAPTATPAPQLVPATAGGVSGAGAATAVATSPMPPSTGVDTAVTPFADTSRSSGYSTEPPAGGGAVIEPVPEGVASSEGFLDEGSSAGGVFRSWTVALGALAAASIGVLGFLEISRRRAN